MPIILPTCRLVSNPPSPKPSTRAGGANFKSSLPRKHRKKAAEGERFVEVGQVVPLKSGAFSWVQQRVFPANPSPTRTSPSLLSNTQAFPEKLVRRMSKRVEKEAIIDKWDK
ncbi:hypothetical protein K443DRAFT_5656 [Laccaria amethystina LaAM-08-1]|uniref:Uncharacterized protein n=1 Tax=Laccaria amethystina LaAM-08-1 TaxID=1095629 RepID=A0A0C9XZD2_9AGAR|nr:hypothetical protein K443DRAFT_5656 [Laccaria amethystina LaAM-08-1]